MDIAHVYSVIVVLGLVWASAFFRLSVLIWTVLIGAALVLITLMGHLSLFSILLLWLLYILSAGFANLHRLRQRYVLLPILSALKRRLPTISETEREAIEAGHTWWEKELFIGRPRWQNLFALPRPQLSKEEQLFLDVQVEHLCSLLDDWQALNHEHDLPQTVWDYLKQEGFFGLVVPKQYGGHGFSALAHSTIIMKIATRSVSAAVNTMVPNSLGPAELLLHYGTEAQKDHYLPRLAKGTEVPCFALTAPEAGSDAGAMPDTGIVCYGQYEGKEILGIRLNWDKRYITLAPIATVLGLAFYLYDPDQLLGNKAEIGITLCLLPTSCKGVEIGARHYPVYQAFMNGPTRGKDVFVPLDWIIGGPKMAGQGWKMLMECLSIGRSISLPALSTAYGKMVYRYTGAYAKVRKQFNVPLASFEGIEEVLGKIAGHMYVLEAARMMTASAIDLKVKPAIASAIAKYHMTELSRQLIANGMDIHAGHMVQMGPRNFLANAHIANPICITVEGANILTRNLIIFGQGAIRCHPYLLKEVALMSAKEDQVAELDRTLLAHSGYFLSNLVRVLTYGLTGGKFIFTTMAHKKEKKYQRQLTRMSVALALLSDVSLLVLGGSLKRRERISARLGDILGQLYLASAVLKYFHDNGKPNTDVDYVCWTLQSCLHEIYIAADGLLDNFPYPWLGKCLRWAIFPFGQSYRFPKDALCKAIVSSMISHNALRDRLTRYCYNGHREEDLTCQLDKALSQVLIIEPIWKKLHESIQHGKIPRWHTLSERIALAQQNGTLTAEEARALAEYENLKNEIIKVNEFSFDLKQVLA